MTTAVDRESLAAYLNDHVAASVAALDLMDNLLGAATDPAEETLLGHWRAAVDQDQRTLRTLVDSVGTENKVGQAVAWVGEKVARLKVGTVENGSAFRRLEALETLAIGFNGRRLLWATLDHLHGGGALQSDLDFAALSRAAGEHMEQLEELRLAAAREALTRPPAA